MGKLNLSLARKSTQNKKIQAERNDALYQSKVDRSQVRFMKKKTKKTVANTNKIVQYAQYEVHGARQRKGATKKRAEADVNAAHVRELQTALSC